MDLNRWLRLIAGVFILASLLLGTFVTPKWYLFTGFVALNLIQSAFTNWCPMMAFLRRLGVRQ
jgi:Inner membrane protein YgaP-like, transmembrane domain